MKNFSIKLLAILLFLLCLLLQFIMISAINDFFNLHMLLKTQISLPIIIDIGLLAICKANKEDWDEHI